MTKGVKKVRPPHEISEQNYLLAAETGESMNSIARKFNLNYCAVSKFLKEFYPEIWVRFRMNGKSRQQAQSCNFTHQKRLLSDVENLYIR